MPRRKSVSLVRDIGVDDRFKSAIIQKMINCVMERGKKSIARRVVYEALDILGKKIGGGDAGACEAFEKAVAKVKPAVEVRPRRVGGSVYQIPSEVRTSRALALALRWIIRAAAVRSDKTMGKRLASELIEISEGRGNAMKKRTDVHKMAESNRAFSHYSW